MAKVLITQYKWAGNWGPFKIKSHCSDCDTTTAMLKSMMGKEFKGKPVTFEIKPWLNSWLKVLLQGAWHAPIVFVNGKKFWQFSHKEIFFNREKLKERVEKELTS